MTWTALDLFNLLQITGTVLALLFAFGLEASNRRLHRENKCRDKSLDLPEFPNEAWPVNLEADVTTPLQVESRHDH